MQKTRTNHLSHGFQNKGSHSFYPKLGSALYQVTTIHLTEDGQEMVEEIGFVPVTAY